MTFSYVTPGRYRAFGPCICISNSMVMTITNVTNPNCGYNKEFTYVVDLENHGVPSRYIEWCDANCENLWGWHFWQDPHVQKIPWDGDWLPHDEVTRSTKAYISFESYDEMILFKFINLSG